MVSECREVSNILAKPYKSLLLKIATGFGFDSKQSNRFLEEIYSDPNNHYSNQHLGNFSMRLYLSKIMVNKCIFKISNELFCQGNTGASSTRFATNYFNSTSLTYLKLQNVSLISIVPFVLNKTSEFSLEEIAYLLNISTMKVKERINKACSYL